MRELVRHTKSAEGAETKSISTSASKSNPRGEYNKISGKQKCEFIRLITHQNYTIKQAAEQTLINYSSAKSIFMTYRRQSKKKHSNNYEGSQKLEQAVYRTCRDTDICAVVLVNSVGGVEVSETTMMGFRKGEGKKMKEESSDLTLC